VFTPAAFASSAIACDAAIGFDELFDLDEFQRIQDEFARAGVEIMSPHVTMLRDGHDLAYPAAHHPPGAAPGRLRVETAVAPAPAVEPGR